MPPMSHPVSTPAMSRRPARLAALPTSRRASPAAHRRPRRHPEARTNLRPPRRMLDDVLPDEDKFDEEDEGGES